MTYLNNPHYDKVFSKYKVANVKTLFDIINIDANDLKYYNIEIELYILTRKMLENDIVNDQGIFYNGSPIKEPVIKDLEKEEPKEKELNLDDFDLDNLTEEDEEDLMAFINKYNVIVQFLKRRSRKRTRSNVH